jgi:histone acetyltransferase (RNA polymerase elongator complex component)
MLMVKEAEKIANKKRIAIISGVGVRDYYRKKLGYRLSKTYMIKTF